MWAIVVVVSSISVIKSMAKINTSNKKTMKNLKRIEEALKQRGQWHD